MIKLEKIIILTNKNYIKILYKGGHTMNNKYFKINGNRYILINKDAEIIKAENEENIINFLEIKNRLIELQEKLKKKFYRKGKNY